MDRYKRQIYCLGLDLTGNHHDAEDLAQDVFLKAFQSIGNFRGDSRISSWLHRIAVNAHIDSKKKEEHKYDTSRMTILMMMPVAFPRRSIRRSTIRSGNWRPIASRKISKRRCRD